MKRLFLSIVIVALSALSTVNAQDISKSIIGMWDLKTIMIDGDEADAEEVFGTKLSQQYMADGSFIGRTGNDSVRGTHTISADSKTIHIKTFNPTQSVDFKVVHFQAEWMRLEMNIDGDPVLLNYLKR